MIDISVDIFYNIQQISLFIVKYIDKILTYLNGEPMDKVEVEKLIDEITTVAALFCYAQDVGESAVRLLTDILSDKIAKLKSILYYHS